MRKAAVAFILLALGAGFAVVFAPRPSLSTSIDIAASPSRVWAVLADTSAYPDWNPGFRLVGTLTQGGTIENIVGHGDSQMVFRPKLLTVRAPEELRWLGHYKLPGLFDAEHYFLLKPNGSGTTLVQGENLSGLAMYFYDVQGLKPGFLAVNAALKARAEAH